MNFIVNTKNYEETQKIFNLLQKLGIKNFLLQKDNKSISFVGDESESFQVIDFLRTETIDFKTISLIMDQIRRYSNFVFNFSLMQEPFMLMRSNMKSIEIRLNEPKRSILNIDDEIVFSYKNETCKRTIAGVIKYSCPRKFFEDIDPKCFGWNGKSIDYMLDFMINIYGEERVNQFGFIGIKLR